VAIYIIYGNSQIKGKIMKYTHKTVFIEGHGKTGEQMSIDIERAINLLEYEGWEYLHPLTLSAGSYAEVYLIFRRERTEQTE